MDKVSNIQTKHHNKMNLGVIPTAENMDTLLTDQFDMDKTNNKLNIFECKNHWSQQITM